MSRRERRIIKKGIATVLTLIFMALVRPDHVSVLGVSFTTLMIYMSLYWCVCYIWRIKSRSDRYISLNKVMRARREMREVELQKFRRVG